MHYWSQILNIWSVCRVWAPGRPPQTRKQRKIAKNSEKQRKTAKRPFLAPRIAVKSQNLNFESLQTLPVYSIHPPLWHIQLMVSHTTPNEAWKQANSGDIDNQWMAVVNSATVIFGAKMAVIDEILNVYKLADSQNPFSALPIWCF